MDHIYHLNRAIDYIEANLLKPLAVEQVATSVGYSRCYFDRLFLARIGDTPASYLRKRRLTEAAREIICSDKSLLDIALDYQFQSQEAFTRAFKRMFGLSPGAYRKRRRLARPFFKITVRPRPIFYLHANRQAPQLLLPSQHITTIRPMQAVLLVTSPTDGLLFKQEVIYARRLTPTQLCLTLGWTNAFHPR